MQSLCTFHIEFYGVLSSIIFVVLLGSILCLDCFACVALSWFIFVYMYSGCGTHWVCGWKAGCCLWCQCLDCAYLFWSSGVHGESMWLLDLWELDISYCFCLCSTKYDQSCCVGYFKYGWKCCGYQHASVRHMSLNCAQTVHHMPQSALWVHLEFLVIPDQIVAELCGLVGYCSLLLCWLHSQSERIGTPETVLPTVVWYVLYPCCACGGPWL